MRPFLEMYPSKDFSFFVNLDSVSVTVSPGGIDAYRLRIIVFSGKSDGSILFVQSHLVWWFLSDTISCNEILRYLNQQIQSLNLEIGFLKVGLPVVSDA